MQGPGVSRVGSTARRFGRGALGRQKVARPGSTHLCVPLVQRIVLLLHLRLPLLQPGNWKTQATRLSRSQPAPGWPAGGRGLQTNPRPAPTLGTRAGRP